MVDIEKILEAASNAPSGANMQPFNIYSVTGAKLNTITNKLINYIKDGGETTQDIQYYPVNWINPYKRRRIKTGTGLYELLKIDRKDKKVREDKWFDNFRWFGAGNVFFVTINEKLIKDSQGMLIDSGILLQTIILAAEGLGYKSCPQGATTEYAKIIKPELEIPEEESLLYSIVIGTPTEDIINEYKPTKISYKETVKHIS